MLLSMTGFGTGRAEANGTSATIEIRSVNNRHLKVTVRGSDPYPGLEFEFEKLIRKQIRRGTVTVAVRMDRPSRLNSQSLNPAVLQGYLDQLAPVAAKLTPAVAAALYSGVLALPGVSSSEASPLSAPEEEWGIVEQAVETALKALTKMRVSEGRQMADELAGLVGQIADRVALVKEQTPLVVAEYRKRLHERISHALSASGVSLDESNLIREIALYADRTDVSEELTRLTGHIAAVGEVIRTGSEGAGRRLEFLAQELGREANTLGSKAGDAVVSRHAVEIKAVLEKFRELVLNVE